jgi:hypothetical protein
MSGDPPSEWNVKGTYFEVCNCDAICPCRRQGSMKGGNSSYGICEFLLSWRIDEGSYDGTSLANLNVGLAGRYEDSDPDRVWHVVLYVDERGNAKQQKYLENIFLGRVGGTAYRNYACQITEVYSVRPARIELDHTKNNEHIKIGSSISAKTQAPVNSTVGVSCGIPGHDQPGQEVIAEHFQVKDSPFNFQFEGRCGFATKFSYKSD